MDILVKNNVELMELAREALHILVNVRHHTKYWDEHYGALAKTAKKKWEARADDFLERLKAEKTTRMSEVKIKNRNENPLQVSVTVAP
jgi:hypothetical protein